MINGGARLEPVAEQDFSTKKQSLNTAPMVLPVLMWIVGLIVGKNTAFPAYFWVAGLISVFILALFIKKARNLHILLIFICFGGFRISLADGKISPLEKSLKKHGKSRQEMIYEVQNRLGEKSYQARLLQIGEIQLDEAVILFGDEEIEEEKLYSALGEIEYLYQDPVLDFYSSRFVASIRAVLPPQELPISISKGRIDLLREWIINRLDNSLGGYAPLSKALLLGNSQFKKEHGTGLSRAGITHLVVVSGLHVVMLGMILMMLLRFVLSRKLAELIFMILLLGFAALNNWAPPILRAMLMLDLVIISRWLSRPPSSRQILALALFIITLVHPEQFFSLGLQMSFLCVAIIVFVLPRLTLSPELSLSRRIILQSKNYLILTIALGLGLAPLTLYHFGTASLNSLLGNLLGIPLMYVLLSLSLLILVFPITPFVLSFKLVSELWQAWLNLCSALPFYVEGNWVSLPQAIAMALLILLLFFVIKRKYLLLKRLGLPVAAIIVILLFIPTNHKNELYIFNAGVADCSLIFADDGTSLMIDTGEILGSRAEQSFDPELRRESWMGKRLLSWLKRNKISKIDHLIITHLHSDHAGGLRDLSHALKIKNLYLDAYLLDGDEWLTLAQTLKLKDCKVHAVSDTFSLALGSHRLKFLHPDGNYRDINENNRSIVCRYDTSAQSFLFTGDIESDAEAWLADRYGKELKADVLKVPHHGSKSSSTAEFLSWVMPQEAVFCTRRSNLYGFPHAEVSKRYEEIGALMRYSYEGTLRYKTQ